MKYKITVFTPMYNRAYIIEQLYRSLQKQTYTDFEWLIVDDGSSDNTEKIINAFIKNENNFSIRYYKKANGGKCSAINYALDLAEGELFYIVDSDDYITCDALEKIAHWEGALPKNEKYCGVAGNLGIDENTTANNIFENEYFDGTLLDRYKNVDGERAFVFYTDIHKKYKFPIFENEKFMTEAVVYNRMAHDGYKMRFFNDIICVYEYKEDGLTKAGNALFVNNPHGYGLWLKEKTMFTNNSLVSRLRLYYTFTCELKDKYDNKLIADCIGTSKFNICLCKAIHKFVRLFK